MSDPLTKCGATKRKPHDRPGNPTGSSQGAPLVQECGAQLLRPEGSFAHVPTAREQENITFVLMRQGSKASAKTREEVAFSRRTPTSKLRPTKNLLDRRSE